MKKLLLLSLAVWVIGCSPEPKPINYGEDICEFCKMTVVDQQHAAELVTSKGKVFKFDAIECMMNYRQQNKETDYALILVNGYLQPGKLIDASQAHYLISQAIPSPMGAFLTAFQEKTEAQKILDAKGGELYDWQGLVQHFEKQK